MSLLDDLMPKPSPPLPFPFMVFPLPIRKFIEDASESINCVTDFLGGAVLVTAAIAVGNESRIEIKKGWVEPPIIYLAAIGEPSTKKSPAMYTALTPISNLQIQFYDAYRAAADDKEAKGSPIFESIITTDTTMEAFAQLLSDNEHGILLFKDEIMG